MRVARVIALSSVSFAVFYAFYRRSRLLKAGTEVDAVFTFIGLYGFMHAYNPITFAGISVSFAQFPMALLGHLPAYLIGFDRLGASAVHVAIAFQVAMLLALLTVFALQGRSFVVQAATAALAAAVFWNRFTVLVCNLTGYAIPSITLGIMFLSTTVDDQPFAVTAPRIGGLLMLAIMHHYPGVFFVLPLVTLWLLAGRRPSERIGTFLRANVPLVAAVLALVVCVAIRPELLLPRLRSVTAPTLDMEAFRAKVVSDWHYLTGPFPSDFARVFFRESPGSWHLLNIAPLGDLVAPIVAANWLVTAVALGRRGVEYGARLIVLGACLVVLTGLQHVVTGFENYRDMVLLLGMVTPGIGFVFVAPRLSRRPARWLLLAYGVAVATYQLVDVGNLAGRHYEVAEYAPEQQAQLEALRRFWRDGADEQLRGAVVQVVAKEPFPLESLYRDAARQHGITLQFVTDEIFCAYPTAVADDVLGGSCGRAAIAVPTGLCGPAVEALGWPVVTTGVTTIYFFDSACGSPPPRDSSTPEVVPLP